MAADPRLVRAVDPRRVATPPQPPPPPPPSLLEQKQVSVLNGVHDREENGAARRDQGGFKLRFCTVCASNQNRYECFRGIQHIHRVRYMKSIIYTIQAVGGGPDF